MVALLAVLATADSASTADVCTSSFEVHEEAPRGASLIQVVRSKAPAQPHDQNKEMKQVVKQLQVEKAGEHSQSQLQAQGGTEKTKAAPLSTLNPPAISDPSSIARRELLSKVEKELEKEVEKASVVHSTPQHQEKAAPEQSMPQHQVSQQDVQPKVEKTVAAYAQLASQAAVEHTAAKGPEGGKQAAKKDRKEKSPKRKAAETEEEEEEEEAAGEDPAATHKAAADKATIAQKAFAETVAAEKVAAQKIAEETKASEEAAAAEKVFVQKQAEARKAANEQAAAEKLAAEKAEEQKIAKEKAAASQKVAAQKKTAAQKASAEQDEAKKAASAKFAEEKAASEKASEARRSAAQKSKKALKAAAEHASAATAAHGHSTPSVDPGPPQPSASKADEQQIEQPSATTEIMSATNPQPKKVAESKAVARHAQRSRPIQWAPHRWQNKVNKAPVALSAIKQNSVSNKAINVIKQWFASTFAGAVDALDYRTHHSFHDVVGDGGAFLLTLEREPHRARYALDQLKQVGIFPENFTATDAWGTPKEVLDEGCNEGCSGVEAAIAHSHKRALEAALLRKATWTAIFEDDAVPVLIDGMTGSKWDEEFRNIWSKVPKETKIVRLSWCMPSGEGQMVAPPIGDGEMMLTKVHPPGLCTGAYMVHKDIISKLLKIFPCNCSLECCLNWKFFLSKAKDGKLMHEAILSNLDMVGAPSFIKKAADSHRGLDMHGVVMQAFDRLGTALEPEARAQYFIRDA